MEWGIGESSERYSAVMSNEGEAMVLATFLKDGEKQENSSILVSSDDFPGRLVVEIDGTPMFAHVARVGDDWWIHLDGRIHVIRGYEPGGSQDQATKGGLSAPMPGTILEVLVKQGQRVREGQTLLVMEAMKMEHKILAPSGGEVSLVHYKEGDRVDMGSVLIEMKE